MKTAILTGSALIATAINQEHVSERIIALMGLIVFFFIWDCVELAVRCKK